MESYVRIFDTTLRDGEQSPGATMTSAEKLELARALARLGVDVIEAGFPAASPDDLEAVRRIAVEVGNPIDGGRALRLFAAWPERMPKMILKKPGRRFGMRPARASTLFLATSRQFTWNIN